MTDLVEDLRDRVRELKAEVADLKSWKQEAISVMPPFQEIGQEIDVIPGRSVHDKILPWIIAAKERLRRLNELEHNSL